MDCGEQTSETRAVNCLRRCSMVVAILYTQETEQQREKKCLISNVITTL